jgi:hypothetical protein
MKKKAFSHLGMLLGTVLLLSVLPVSAQTQDKSVARLKLENNRLRTIAEDKNTPPEIRELNQQLLLKNENLLRQAILKGISALEDYQTKNADLLDDNDRQEINEKIEAHKYDLAQLGVKEIPKSTGGKESVETVAVKDESSEIPKAVPASFAPKTNLSVASAKKTSTAKTTVSPSKESSTQVPKVRLNTPNSDVTVSTNKLNVEVEVDDGISSITLIVNGVAKNFEVKANKKVQIPIVLNETVTRIEAFNTNDNSEKSGEVVVTLNTATTSSFNAENTFNWGRVRGYFTSGVIYSQTRETSTASERINFSKPDIYLDFTLDKNYASNRKGSRILGAFNDVNTFFTARLTSLGIAAPKETTTTTTAATTEECNSAECNTFLSSEKVARLEVGVYLPKYVTWWGKINPAETDELNKWRNTLFIAPIFRGGIQTIVGDRKTSESKKFGGDDVYNFFSGGIMVGHLEHFNNKRDYAPNLVSYLSVTYGRFENFEYLDPDGPKDDGGNLLRRVRPWRFEASGRLKVPETPIVVGFDGNFGKGPDDLRFIFGVKFDIGKVLNILKINEAKEKQEGQP